MFGSLWRWFWGGSAGGAVVALDPIVLVAPNVPRTLRPAACARTLTPRSDRP